MNYPLIKQESDYPKDSICPVCGKNKIGEPDSFAVLQGGAMLYNDEGDSIFPSNLMGFLELVWHGHHDDGIEDEDSNISSVLNIIDNSTDGQFGLYFCSTACLRKFFMELVDDLEQQVVITKNKKETSKQFW